ncbi:MAG: hypothetical protein ACRDJH_23445 [Thermomicrobiales bacterium]
MGKLLTLIAEVGDTLVQAADLPADFAMRPCRLSDTQSLGRLYYEAYEPGVAAATLDEAVADIRACFDGAYGDLWPAASLAIHRGDTLAAAHHAGAPALALRVAPDNVAARSLYASRGFGIWQAAALARLGKRWTPWLCPYSSVNWWAGVTKLATVLQDSGTVGSTIEEERRWPQAMVVNERPWHKRSCWTTPTCCGGSSSGRCRRFWTKR